MPALVAALGDALIYALGSWLGKVLVGLGVGAVAYTGVSALVSALNSQIATVMASAQSSEFSAAMQYFGVNDAVSILTAAYIARFGTQTVYRLALSRAAS